MKGSSSQQSYFKDLLQFNALLWLLLAPMGISASDSVLIIKSNDNQYFSTSIEQVINHVSGQPQFRIFTTDNIDSTQVNLDQVDLIITLGSSAANYSKSLEHDIPVIHSYVTEFQHRSFSQHRNCYTLLLEQPLARYIQFIKLLLTPESIAIIQPEQQRISDQKIKELEDLTQLTINQLLFVEGDNPVKIVRSLLISNDVLLSLPAPEVYNKKSLKGILLSSYRQQKPVISYSPSHVRSGALASIYTSPADIGKQIAQLANQVLQSKLPQEQLFHASDFNILINQQVAKALGLQLPDQEILIRQLRQTEQP